LSHRSRGTRSGTQTLLVCASTINTVHGTRKNIEIETKVSVMDVG